MIAGPGSPQLVMGSASKPTFTLVFVTTQHYLNLDSGKFHSPENFLELASVQRGVAHRPRCHTSLTGTISEPAVQGCPHTHARLPEAPPADPTGAPHVTRGGRYKLHLTSDEPGDPVLRGPLSQLWRPCVVTSRDLETPLTKRTHARACRLTSRNPILVTRGLLPKPITTRLTSRDSGPPSPEGTPHLSKPPQGVT